MLKQFKLNIYLTMKKILFYILLFLTFQLSAQEKEFAHKLIDTLCSPEFQGRGYVLNGDKMAANFIARKLKEFDAKPFTQEFFQSFSINVNTFGTKMSLKIGDKLQTAGVDYLVLSNSCSAKGNYKILVFDKINYTDIEKLRSKNNQKIFIVLDTLGMNNKQEAEKLMQYKQNQLGAAGIIEIFDKNLTYVPSNMVNNFVSIQLKRNNLPEKLKQLSIEVENEYKMNYTTQNVAAFIEGEIDSFIVFSAHYDHLGKMGNETYFPGANDNASGVAMVLNLAKYFSEHKPKYSVAFLFFSAEELGILGSAFYNQKPLFPLSRIKFLTNLDMVGSGDKGIKVVNATVFKKEFDILQNINNQNNYLSQIGARTPAANSDHYFFYENKVPCFFIYTLGEYSEYHNINDKSDKLPLSKYDELFNLIVKFAFNL